MTANKTAVPNNIKLSRFLIGLALFYGLISCIALVLIFSPEHRGITAGEVILYLILYSAIPAVHVITAWGCRRKSEVARHVAKFIGFLMFTAVPIGTVLSLFYLPLTDWEQEPAADVLAANSSKA